MVDTSRGSPGRPGFGQCMWCIPRGVSSCRMHDLPTESRPFRDMIIVEAVMSNENSLSRMRHGDTAPLPNLGTKIMTNSMRPTYPCETINNSSHDVKLPHRPDLEMRSHPCRHGISILCIIDRPDRNGLLAKRIWWQYMQVSVVWWDSEIRARGAIMQGRIKDCRGG